MADPLLTPPSYHYFVKLGLDLKSSLFFYLAPDGSCISVEAAATSLTIKWCQRLADAFTANGTYVLVGIRRQDNITQTSISLWAMELTVRGLSVNTEYELLFDVATYEGPRADALTIPILARHFRTNYFCKSASS